jgi:hypothetical protein
MQKMMKKVGKIDPKKMQEMMDSEEMKNFKM